MSTHRLRRDGITCSDLGSEVVILDLGTSVYFSARNAAAVLVDSLLAGATEQAMAARLVTGFGIDADVAERDVQDFLAQLRGRNLLEPVEA